MNCSRKSPSFARQNFALLLAVLLTASFEATAQDKKAPAPKVSVPTKPAAPPHPAAPNAPGRSSTPTTGSRGPTTTGSSNPVTTANPRGPNTGGSVHTTNPSMGNKPGGHALAGGHSVPAGNRIIRTPSGNELRTRPDGRPADVHVAARGMDIHHGLNGDRHVLVDRPDHSRIYVERGGRGYVQRPYMYHGHEFGHRTYYYHGRAYDRFYRPYPYHGVFINVYAPAVYYRPAFYGWVYNPWAVPIAYPWGWPGNPWYGYYGFYFTPYPVYPSASVWLTDYLISTTLAAAYEAQAEAAAAAAQAGAPPDASPLTPQVKELIAEEVQRQVALENAEAQTAGQNAEVDPASSGIQRMLTDNVQHVFVVGNSLDLVDAQGMECSVTQGDALQLLAAGPVAPDATSVGLIVLSSKGGRECRRGNTVSVTVGDLQDMQNHMRETVDQGMGELQAKQAQGGLPPIPASAAGPPTKTAFAAQAPPPDPNAVTEINQESQAADKAENEVLTQVARNSGTGSTAPVLEASTVAPAAAATPATVSTGMTIDEVTTALGTPKSIVNLGTKKIYVYTETKVVFKDGKVSDVQ